LRHGADSGFIDIAMPLDSRNECTNEWQVESP